MKYRAICTAIVVPGVHTARVDRVIRPTREARDLLAQADAIRRERNTADNARRLGLCEPHPASARRPFRVVSISIYCDDLQRLDALVAKARRAGNTTMTRSRLIREAVKAIAGEPTRAP